MSAPTTAFSSLNVHLVAAPWSAQVTVAAGERRHVAFLNVTRTVRVATATTSGAFVAFSGPDANPLAATEHPVTDISPLDATVQLTGCWLVNRGDASATFYIFATLAPDAAAGWPVYSAAAGFDAIDVAPVVATGEALE